MTETIKPRIGGVIAGIAWTGGKPKSVERDESELSEPRTPFCFRPISAGDGLKVYSKQTTVPTGTKLFARTDPLTAFEFDVLDHLESTGMDSIIWIETPYRPKELPQPFLIHLLATGGFVGVYCLGYVPITSYYYSNFITQKKFKGSQKSFCFNRLLDKVLESFINTQQPGALDNIRLRLDMYEKVVSLKAPLFFVIGDIQGGDKIAG